MTDSEKTQKLEKIWVSENVVKLQTSLKKLKLPDSRILVSDGVYLNYALRINRYNGTNESMSKAAVERETRSKYQTDILISEHYSDGTWIPRVIVECKLRVNTHDALTYSSKAASHKNLHPYLRYGFLMASPSGEFLPTRLFWHGAYFDFMVAWSSRDSTRKEWSSLIKLLTEEIEASRNLENIMTDRTRTRDRFRILHKKLSIET